ncbi:MAG: large subunit ribosomal protein L22 [Candidatus Saganbacteria bacterium]|uniref:Large ribosomal subunit protein uL22 n=1 Tax=Candidatus Saganbacteria bacterium TaxID=2575572 RepID=A0A833NYK7_UNCSA|nr:MAG: large subunit ribosomal protein L22 [Candidatus Saganbacteria bacterium]
MIKVKAQAKWVRTSALKVRRILKLIQGKKAEAVLDILKFMPQKAAAITYKVLKSAIANAKNNYKLSTKELIISEAYADTASMLKRIRPRARGRAFPIKKRISHITVVVSGKEME